MAVCAQLGNLRQHIFVIPATDKCKPGDLTAWFGGQIDDRVDECRRQVVDHVPTEVFKHVCRA